MSIDTDMRKQLQWNVSKIAVHSPGSCGHSYTLTLMIPVPKSSVAIGFHEQRLQIFLAPCNVYIVGLHTSAQWCTYLHACKQDVTLHVPEQDICTRGWTSGVGDSS
jgi:hypothetical protein